MAAFNTYDYGDVVRLTGTFKNQSDIYVDPGEVRCKIKDPLGNVVTYVHGVDSEVEKLGVGQYAVQVDATIEGRWVYRWEGLTSNKGADETVFQVRNSNFY